MLKGKQMKKICNEKETTPTGTNGKETKCSHKLTTSIQAQRVKIKDSHF